MCNPGACLDLVPILTAWPRSTEKDHLEVSVLVGMSLFFTFLVQDGNRHGRAMDPPAFFSVRNALYAVPSCFIEQAVQGGGSFGCGDIQDQER